MLNIIYIFTVYCIGFFLDILCIQAFSVFIASFTLSIITWSICTLRSKYMILCSCFFYIFFLFLINKLCIKTIFLYMFLVILFIVIKNYTVRSKLKDFILFSLTYQLLCNYLICNNNSIYTITWLCVLPFTYIMLKGDLRHGA